MLTIHIQLAPTLRMSGSILLILQYAFMVCEGRTLSLLLRLLVSMTVKHNNVLLNLITGCLYWLTNCFGQLNDDHQVYKS